MTKNKKQLEKELKETQEKLLQKARESDRFSSNCYYAGKYLQILRVMQDTFRPIDYDRVLNVLEQDKYLD